MQKSTKTTITVTILCIVAYMLGLFMGWSMNKKPMCFEDQFYYMEQCYRFDSVKPVKTSYVPLRATLETNSSKYNIQPSYNHVQTTRVTNWSVN